MLSSPVSSRGRFDGSGWRPITGQAVRARKKNRTVIPGDVASFAIGYDRDRRRMHSSSYRRHFCERTMMMRGGEGGDVSSVTRAIKIFYSSLFFVETRIARTRTGRSGMKEGERMNLIWVLFHLEEEYSFRRRNDSIGRNNGYFRWTSANTDCFFFLSSPPPPRSKRARELSMKGGSSSISYARVHIALWSAALSRAFNLAQYDSTSWTIEETTIRMPRNFRQTPPIVLVAIRELGCND